MRRLRRMKDLRCARLRGERASRVGSRLRALVIVATASFAVATAPALASGPADARYLGGGINEKGYLDLRTSSEGNVSFYNVAWHRTICGIKHFAISFATLSPWQDMSVDDDGNFSETFSMVYEQAGRKYRVRASSVGRFGPYAVIEGKPDDQVWFQQTVRVRRMGKKGAKWCRAQTHEWIGFREAPEA